MSLYTRTASSTNPTTAPIPGESRPDLMAPATAVLALRSKFDHAANVYLDLDVVGVQQANQEGRKNWASCVLAIAALLAYHRASTGQAVSAINDPVLTSYGLVYIPWLLATSSREIHRRVGWLTVCGMYFWCAMRFLFPNPAATMAPVDRSGMLFFVAAVHLEVCIENVTTIALNHLLMNVAAMALVGPLSSWRALAVYPLGSMATFAVFCWRRRRKTDGGPLRLQVGELARSASQRKLAGGTGSGMDWHDADEQVLDLDMDTLFGMPGEAGDWPDMQEEPSDLVTSDVPRLGQVLGGLATEGVSDQSHLPFLEDMVRMSLDAMGQVDLHTGALLWRNPSFDQLMVRVGGGDAWAGQQALFGQFLQNLPTEERRISASIGQDTTPLISVTKVVKTTDTDRVVWVLRAGGVCTNSNPSGRSSAAPSPAAAEDTMSSDLNKSSSEHAMSSEQFPSAADHPSPLAKVMLHDSGKGKRPSILLWQRYGKKSLYKPGAAQSTRVNRVYYKCFHSGCKARLKVDVRPHTGEQISANPLGVHNHGVQLTR
eukprot:TRINITY_DN1233_c0_g2_i2.p1 TRINITY_DN1233_c0_g2~~TRINITY_DN1233_c0_g2_i2.p1  ORF type:complete len:543 (+),score=61.89 TRINITY_DN1233_c0_g2_i2:1729-3357(+)